MVLQFQPYPVPPEQADPWANTEAKVLDAVKIFANVHQQQKMEAAKKEETRQQRIMDYMKLKADYGDQVNDWAGAAGLSVPGAASALPGSGIAPAPVAAPMGGPPVTAGLGVDPALSAPAAAPAGPPAPSSILDLSPAHLADIRRTRGAKGAEQFMKDANFQTGTAKDALELKLKQEALEKANRGKKYVTREELEARPDRILQPGEELMPIDPMDKLNRTAGMNLSNEFSQQSKDFRTVANTLPTITKAAPNASGDMQLIYGLMKIYDPNSVVRETEFANAENARGVPDSIRNAWNKAQSGTFLTDAQRKEFKDAALNVYGGRLEQQKQLENEFRRQAAGWGLDPNQIIRNYAVPNLPPGGGAPEVKGAAQQPNGQAPAAAGPHGKTVKQGAHVYTWNPTTQRYE